LVPVVPVALRLDHQLLEMGRTPFLGLLQLSVAAAAAGML
jgi:hypothetical protein